MARRKKVVTIERGGKSYERTMPSRKGMGSIVNAGGIFKIKLHVGDNKYRWFSSKGYNGSDGRNLELAEQYRRDLLGQIARGELKLAEAPEVADADRVKVMDLLGDLVKKYQEKERRSTDTLLYRINSTLAPFFGDMLARDCTADLISTFIEQHREKHANSTINRSLAVIRTAFKLGHRTRRITADMVPWIEMLPEAEPRPGFIELDDYDRLMEVLPAPLKPLLALGFFSGIRVGECRSIRWDWVDWDAEIIILPGRVTKNGNQRFIPIPKGSELRAILEAHKAVRETEAPDCPWVCFWYGKIGHGVMTGDQIRVFRAGWKAATKQIGKPGLLFHDLRRSAIKLMTDAGETESKVMAVTGHETRAVFDRYFKYKAKDVVATGARVADFVSKKRGNQ
jgi:integrase